MKRNHLYSLIGSLLLSHAAFAQEKVIFKGTADPKFNGEKVQLYNSQVRKADTAIIRDGKFEFVLPFKEGDYPYFSSSYELRVNHGYVPFGILVDKPGTINIKARMDSFYLSEVSGAAAFNIIQQFNKEVERKSKKDEGKLSSRFDKDLLDKPWEHMKAPDFPAFMKAKDSIYALNLVAVMEKYLKKYKGSQATSFMIDRNGNDLPLEKKEQYYPLLSKQRQEDYYGLKVKKNIAGLKASSIGVTVPDILLPDSSGNMVALSSLKGKYVFIDFWASWCMPCRASFPHLREVYKQYKDKPFEIFGISADADKKNWLGALKQENLDWTQVWDGANKENGAVAKMGVTAFPTTFLIGPDGKIIAKNLHGEELDKKLEEVLK